MMRVLDGSEREEKRKVKENISKKKTHTQKNNHKKKKHSYKKKIRW